MKKLEHFIVWVWLKVAMCLGRVQWRRDHDRLKYNLVVVSVCESNKAICAFPLHCVTYQGHRAQVKAVLNLSQEQSSDNAGTKEQGGQPGCCGFDVAHVGTECSQLYPQEVCEPQVLKSPATSLQIFLSR